MPTITRQFKGPARTQRLDARPDRVDFRDREYRPVLESLPPEYPDRAVLEQIIPEYTRRLILNQGDEGACTGFGLAAVVNYLLFARSLDTGEAVERVSARMLYHMARSYDEWSGEDYAGSSCRGAMKGWHRHGVCRDLTWPYRDDRSRIRFVKPKRGWQNEAARVPLGAYYRIDKTSIVDMQAALYEVGAIYATAEVHDGWDLDPAKDLPVIDVPDDLGDTGGHAFAIVGYTAVGFIVQNSWGEHWGFQGFAVMTYRDWIERGMDAWVAVLGAPVALQKSRHGSIDLSVSRTRSSVGLRDAAAGRAEWFWRRDRTRPGYRYRDSRAEPISESLAYQHTVVLGNNGRPLSRFVDVEDESAALEEAVVHVPRERLDGARTPRLLIYAHGGLNHEEASLERVRVMAPYFRENGIHPLFITWRTGFMESLTGMLEDALLPSDRVEPAEGFFDRLEDFLDRAKERLAEARDRSVEVAC